MIVETKNKRNAVAEGDNTSFGQEPLLIILGGYTRPGESESIGTASP